MARTGGAKTQAICVLGRRAADALSRCAKPALALGLSLSLCAAPIAFAAPDASDAGSAASATAASTSASSKASTADAPAATYAGAYSGVVVANAEERVVEGEDAASTEKRQNTALSQNGGVLRVIGGKLSKAGNDDDEQTCALYGVNAVALAVGKPSWAAFADVTIESTSVGSSGLFATDSATLYANGCSIDAVGDGAGGLATTFGGTIAANGMTVQTKGKRSPAVSAESAGGVSLANSTMKTTGSESPLVQVTGAVELDNVQGQARASQILRMGDTGSALLNGCTLESAASGADAADAIASAIALYREAPSTSATAGGASTGSASASSTSAGSTASGSAEADSASAGSSAMLLQMVDTHIASALESGTLFYLANTTAAITLADVDLDFDAENVKLLVAQGNDADGWGDAGKNGATVTLTGIDQTLEGDIEVDSISSLDLLLLNGSAWEGSSKVALNSAGTALTNNITVTVDATSGWVVTEDSVISNLNIEKGGKLVDTRGKAVMIMDEDGNKLVDGASDVKVTVTGEFSTNVQADGAQTLKGATIDRAAFDAEFGTSTAFGTNALSNDPSDEERVEIMKQVIRDFFENL